MKQVKEILCSCGGGAGVNHLVSQKGCYRKIAEGGLIPTDFRSENGVEVCTVNGNTITTFTLYNQRMYSFNDGVWTLPKDESSINSIGDNW